MGRVQTLSPPHTISSDKSDNNERYLIANEQPETTIDQLLKLIDHHDNHKED